MLGEGPGHRWQSASDLKWALENLKLPETSSQSDPLRRGKQVPIIYAEQVTAVARQLHTDGRRLAFFEGGLGYGVLWTLPIDNDGAGLRPGKPEIFLKTQFDERNPAFSPDWRWMAYASDEPGTVQVYVRAFPDKGGKWQISSEGGTYPLWSRNGRELFFETLDNRNMVANYTAKGDSFLAEKPQLWSEKRLSGQANLIRNCDLAPDGKRRRHDTRRSRAAQNHVIFLENFFDELRRRVPVSGK